MATLVFTEGLWRTGKSHFVRHLKEIQADKAAFLVHDNLNNFKSAAHGPFLIYPSLFHENQVFDGSPIGLKAIADPSLGIYKHAYFNAAYWEAFYRDWIDILKETGDRIIIIYFRPFHSGEQLAFSGIQKYLLESVGSDLMVDVSRCSQRTLTDLHDVYLEIILKLKKKLRRGMQLYQVEYQDADDAVDALRHERFLRIPKESTPKARVRDRRGLRGMRHP